MKIEAYVETRYIGSTVTEVIEIPDSEIEGMTESEINDYVDDYVQDWMNQEIEWGWKTVDAANQR